VTLLRTQEAPDRNEASKIERQIKRLPREGKEKIIIEKPAN
jgi:predicted GIY-YIG superfamily endonuclease